MSKSSLRSNSNEAMPDVTLRDILLPLFRHRRLMYITFGVVFGLALVVAWGWAARYYRATMQVVVEQDRSDPAVTAAQNGVIYNNRPISTDQVTSEVVLLQGQDMLRTIAGTCGLADTSSIFDMFSTADPATQKAMKQEGVARGLAKKIKVEVAPASDVINVSYGQTGDPETPACVLQNLSKLYLEKHLQLRRPAGAADFFAEQTDKYQKALADSEARLASFGKAEGVAAPDMLRSDMAQQVAISEASLRDAQQGTAAAEQRIESIKAQLAATPARSSTQEVSNSSNVLLQNLQATLLETEVKRTQLLMKYDPSYPLVRETEQEIAQTKEAIKKAEEATYVNKTTDRDPTYEYLRQDLAKTQADLASHKATATALEASIRSMRMEMVRLDGQAVKQGALLREAKANESNYLLYLNKREQERTSDALDKKRIANVAIAVPAVVPLLPAHSPWLVTLLGLFGAFVMSVTAAFVAEYLDHSFRTPVEVAETLSIPVLASVPRRAA
jgi:uncharacterized protein involved in exopolysaccharide biosynthesis